MRHYVYFVQESTTGRLYIGSRSCKVDPELDPYMGSYHDKTFAPDIKWVWAEFQTREEAYSAEETLHKVFDVVKSPTFINRRVGSGAWSSSKLTWWTNGEEETLSEAAPAGWYKGRKASLRSLFVKLGKQSSGKWLKGHRHTQQARLKMSKSHSGKTLSDSHRHSLGLITKGRKWACNKFGETLRLWPSEMLPPGYQWGRTYKD